MSRKQDHDAESPWAHHLDVRLPHDSWVLLQGEVKKRSRRDHIRWNASAIFHELVLDRFGTGTDSHDVRPLKKLTAKPRREPLADTA